MNITEILDCRAREDPEKTALLCGNESISFGELYTRSISIARYFQQQGVHRGLRALLFVPLSVELYVIFLALMRCEVTVVLTDPGANREHIGRCLTDIPVDIFIGVPKAHLLRFLPAIRRIPQKFITRYRLPGTGRIRPVPGADAADFPAAGGDILALITFTSGSTGSPKAIGRTHDFLYRQHLAVEQTLGRFPDDIEINTLPVFILSSLASGMTVSLPDVSLRNPGQADGELFLSQIRKKSVNRLLASPAFCLQLVRYLEQTQQQEPGIDRVYTGGGPVFPNLVTRMQRVFPAATITTVYGSTEAEPVAHHRYDAGAGVHSSGSGLLAGKPCPAIQLAIIDDCDGRALAKMTEEEFTAMRCPVGRTGEIVVTGEHVQKAYLNNDGSQTKIRAGDTVWHRTGDAGYLDGDGNLWLQGRCSAKITCAGQVVYPFGCEAAAMSVPGVRGAAVVSVNDQVVLAIESEDDATSKPAEITARLLENPGIRTVIERVVHVDTIPVDSRHNSKVLYSQLRRELLQEQ